MRNLQGKIRTVSNVDYLSSALLRKVHSLLVLAFILLLYGCGNTPTKPGADELKTGGIYLFTQEQSIEYLRGIKLMEAGDYKKAQSIFGKLLIKQPKVDELRQNTALCYYHNQEFDEALKAVAPLLSKNVAEAHNLAGLITQRNGDFSGAKLHYQKAITQNPSYSNALYNLALLYDVYLQDVTQAVKYYSLYLAQVDDDEQTQGWVDQLKSSIE